MRCPGSGVSIRERSAVREDATTLCSDCGQRVGVSPATLDPYDAYRNKLTDLWCAVVTDHDKDDV